MPIQRRGEPGRLPRKPQPDAIPNGRSIFERPVQMPELFRPGKGANPETVQAFAEAAIPLSASMVKLPPEKPATTVNQEVLDNCIQAAREASYALEIPENVDTLMDKGEYAEYVEEYMAAVLDSIQAFVAEGKRVFVTASPTGGLAPLRGLLNRYRRHYAENPEWQSQVVFSPFLRNKQTFERMRGSDAVIHIEDGMARFSTQIELLYAFEDPQEVDKILHIVRDGITRSGDLNAEELQPMYVELMKRFAKRGIVLAPLFSKNTRFETASRELASQYPENGIAKQQVAFLDAFNMTLLEGSGEEYPGGAIDQVPCRDIGITLGALIPQLTPEARQKLENAGIPKETTFRLLADRADIMSMPEDVSYQMALAFADILNKKLSVR